MAERYWGYIWNQTNMQRDSICFLLQLSLIIRTKWLSHPATSSQFQNMGLKRRLLLHIIWLCLLPSPHCKQLLLFSVTHQIFFLTITSSFHGLLPALRSLTHSSSIDHSRGACLYWSPAGFTHFIHFIKSIFSRIAKAMWAERKKKQAMTDGNPCPSTRGACFSD